MKRALAAGTLLGFAGFLSFGLWVFWTLPEVSKTRCLTPKVSGAKLCPGQYGYVRYEDFPKHLVDALILSEDGSFFSHGGFDWYEIKESFKRNWHEKRFARGGSTLTQQLAKNLYLSQEKTLLRKFREIFIARKIEKVFKKSQILEHYLNVVEFGPDLYGIQKASQHYFQKNPSQLTPMESIYLVSLLPSPKRLSRGFQNKILTKSNRSRMKVIVRRLFRAGKIEEHVYTSNTEKISNQDWPFQPEVYEFELDEDFEELEF